MLLVTFCFCNKDVIEIAVYIEMTSFLQDVANKKANIHPRLRKNPNVENRWGSHYQIAVQHAMFGKQRFPYVPTEPPASLSEEIIESEPLYVCKQCKDCFRFESSFKDHCKRRSWILGFWCHNCFKTVCYHRHNSKVLCTICVTRDFKKRAYLRAKGFTEQTFRRWGATKVFYNQCQLFEHTKMHNLGSINMSDIMLMPLPSNLIGSDWSSELEIACEAIMEHAFLSHVHIMDWLRKNNIEHNWWKLINNNDESDKNPLNKVIKGYQGQQLFKTVEKLTGKRTRNSRSADTVHNVDKNPDIEIIDTKFKDKDKSSLSVNAVADKNVSENEDNPCMSSDIAFVDCGPMLNFLEPEPSVSYVSKKQMTALNNDSGQNVLNWPLTDVTSNKKTNKRKSMACKNISAIGANKIHEDITAKTSEKSLNESNKQLAKSCPQLYKINQPFVMKTARNSISKSINTNADKNQDTPVNINVPAKKIKLCKTNSDHSKRALQAPTENCTSKIVTVQSSKKEDITSIISNLPANLLINNKKIVLLEQDTKRFLTFKNEVSSGKKTNKTILYNVDTDTNIILSQKDQVAGKILVKNGKKYIIKHSENIKNLENSTNLPILASALKGIKRLTTEHNTSTSTSSDEVEIIDTEQTISFPNEISLLTPSPSPSELSSSESHVKQKNSTKFRMILPKLTSPSVNQKKFSETVSLVRKENGELYMSTTLDYAPEEISYDICEEIPKYRQKMIEEFHNLDGTELMKRIIHLRDVNEETEKAINFTLNDARKEKLKFINDVQRILYECFSKCNKKIQKNKVIDVTLNQWRLSKDLKHTCPSCKKTMKPKTYIAGFSKLPKDDYVYCSCYKYVCDKCLSYYGCKLRFIAHQNFHKKEKPYVCPECRCIFASAKYLEIHIWTICFHILKKQVFACKICEIDGFMDIESITRHFVIMHCDIKTVCKNCYKVFSSYEEYMKHNKDQHSFGSGQNPIRLVTCKLGSEIVRCENFMLYLETYPAIQKLTWFKCPFCSLIVPENKHITAVLNAHLRDKHLQRLPEIISKEALTDIFGTEFVESSTSKGITNTFTNATSDSNAVPKIINTRTISSEMFERGSQETDDTWSINSESSAPVILPHDENSQVTKDIDNMKQELDSLPKILNIRSLADMHVTNTTTTKTSDAENNDKRISPTPQLEIKDKKDFEITNEDDDIPCEDIKDTTLNLDDSKPETIKETEEVKEPDKCNNESMTSTLKCEGSSEKTADVCGKSSTKTSTEVSSSQFELRTSTDVHTKIVDIFKPNIESLIVVKQCNMQPGIENFDRMSLISKPPPPLARIPQHLCSSAKDIGLHGKLRNVTKSKFLVRKVNGKSKCRIAISGPTDTQKERIEFLCHLCKDKIDTSWPVIREHFSKKHSHKYELAILSLYLTHLSLNLINSYKQVSSRKKKADNVLVAPKRKRRWTPKKYKDVKAIDMGFCVEEQTAEDGEGNFKCKKCDQRCTNMSDLREHIVTNHRLKGRYLICLECGENFVVESSLQMHLKAFHGIENPIDYMNQNPSYSPDVNSDMETEGRTTMANQCYVCMAVFEDKAAVDKHLRVHGMAFLNRKRIEARNAQKSFKEKVEGAKVEETKQSPVKGSPTETVKQDKPVETILKKINAAI